MPVDSVGYTEGSGKQIATDEVSGVQYQVVKWDIGPPDTSIPLSGSIAFGIPVFTNKGITLLGPAAISGSVSILSLPAVSITGPAAVSGTLTTQNQGSDGLGWRNQSVNSSGHTKVVFATALGANLYSCSTFRTLGTAGTPHSIFSIENGAASTGIIVLRELFLVVDTTAALATVSLQAQLSRITNLPTGGTQLPKVSFDTNQVSNGLVVCRGATASDGGVATAIAAAGSGILKQCFVDRLHTAVGLVSHQPIALLPEIARIHPLILRPGQAFLVQIAGTAASNASTNHYLVLGLWEEISP